MVCVVLCGKLTWYVEPFNQMNGVGEPLLLLGD
jgi:hypothetical protein